ncbi:hypothetical protein D9613_012713 [Agrocybe pediades]|uniref:Ubiquitin-like domain-containing protein n=1 Tax=Agrocybe pediades TaxID=84607 RepID=A0A8H4QLM3_9AGAR|nr:hypothetical protein D9613_012713 [Agrocybe pediades]
MRHTALVESRAYWLTRFIPALSQTSTTMSLSNTKIVSLSRSPVGETTQVNQSFFAGASNITISGGQFLAVAGNYVRQVVNLDPAHDTTLTMAMHNRGPTVQRILLQLLETDLVRRSIAQIVGWSDKNGVTVIDALGEKLVFPPTIMALFSDAHNNLSMHFRGKLGEDRVQSGRYCLVKQGDGMRVNEDDWNTVVQAGEVLVMCMLIEKVWVESRKQTCPRCGDTRLGTQRDGGFYVCRRCGKRFTFERAPSAKRLQPPSEDDNTVATFANDDDVVTLLSRDMSLLDLNQVNAPLIISLSCSPGCLLSCSPVVGMLLLDLNQVNAPLIISHSCSPEIGMSLLDLNQVYAPLIISLSCSPGASKPLSSAYCAVFIHIYQWDAAQRREASRFEEVVEEVEESNLEEEESD